MEHINHSQHTTQHTVPDLLPILTTPANDSLTRGQVICPACESGHHDELSQHFHTLVKCSCACNNLTCNMFVVGVDLLEENQ